MRSSNAPHHTVRLPWRRAVVVLGVTAACVLPAANAWAEGHHEGRHPIGRGANQGHHHPAPPVTRPTPPVRLIGIDSWQWGDALHGQLSLPGHRTIVLQHGVITAVTATTITVQSADGYLNTWTLTPSTDVRGLRTWHRQHPVRRMDTGTASPTTTTTTSATDSTAPTTSTSPTTSSTSPTTSTSTTPTSTPTPTVTVPTTTGLAVGQEIQVWGLGDTTPTATCVTVLAAAPPSTATSTTTSTTSTSTTSSTTAATTSGTPTGSTTSSAASSTS